MSWRRGLIYVLDVLFGLIAVGMAMQGNWLMFGGS
jgi:hypothetical protein